MMSRPGRIRRKTVIAGSILLAVAGLGVLAYERLAYRYALIVHPPALAAAIYVYQNHHGDLPPRLSVIQETGCYGKLPYRLPSHGLDLGWNGYSGPEPHYLPVFNWDGKTRYIVAIAARPPRSRAFSYVILGDTRAYGVANSEQMAKLLAADDEARRTTGQPGSWDDVPWRE
ncbi:MAG: hypothetical protein ACYS5V_05515 [Planctomycetota bacterium]|jgi:hypothetical protein